MKDLFGRNEMKTRVLLSLVYIAFLLKGAFYCLVFPVWEGYDEFAHYAFVEYLAVNYELPEQNTRISEDVQTSLALAPLPWMLRRLGPPHLTHDDYWRLPEHERRKRENQLPALGIGLQSHQANDFLYEGKQPPLYYWLLSWIFRLSEGMSLPQRVFMLRFVSVFIASAVIPIAFATGKYLFKETEPAMQMTLLVQHYLNCT